MTCEKFEDALMDELYGELDEVTSAALRRHASSCVRCAERLSSMRATRKVLASAFAPVDPPADLEGRIFAAAAEARKVVPIRSRMTRFVSVAGRWAMRPQTAMAAVFLVMIGSSVVFMRERPASMSRVVVTERGAPAESAGADPAVADNTDKNADLSAAAAHGPEPVRPASPTAAATVTATSEARDREKGRAEASPLASAFAMNERKAVANADDSFSPRPRSAMPRGGASPGGLGGAASGGGAAAEGEAIAAARAPAKAASAPPPVQAQAAATPAAVAPAESQGSPFADAMAAYRGKRYSEATRMFDSLAQQGDANAALWAARSERESSGCSSAVGRFDRIGASSYGTAAGYDATLEAGRCYRSLGSFEAARARFARLLTVPSHAAKAQAELDAMSPRAAKPSNAAPATKPASGTGAGF